MARPRTPTAILNARNAFRKHPERRRATESKCTGPLGDPPAALSRHEKAMWHEIAALLTPGVAGKSDRIAFEVLVKIASKVRHRGIGDGGATNGELHALNSLAARFGMTPADRSKISAPQEDDAENIFAKLAKESRTRPN